MRSLSLDLHSTHDWSADVDMSRFESGVSINFWTLDLYSTSLRSIQRIQKLQGEQFRLEEPPQSHLEAVKNTTQLCCHDGKNDLELFGFCLIETSARQSFDFCTRYRTR